MAEEETTTQKGEKIMDRVFNNRIPEKCGFCNGTLHQVQEFDMRYTECLMCGRVEYSAVHKAKVLQFKKPKPPQ